MYQNKLIFGKNSEENIVSVEATDDGLVLFREVNGELLAEVIDNKFWLITNKRVSGKQTQLAGNQFYKYLATFDTEAEKNEAKKSCYKNRIDFYHINDPKEASLVYNGLTYFKGSNPKDISILSFDIETDGLAKHSGSEIYLITNTFRKNGKIIKKTFDLSEYTHELHPGNLNQEIMLMNWCAWVRECDPTLMIGHNIYGYDFGYIQHVANLHGVELKLGRDESTIRFNNYTSKFRKDGSQDYEYFNCHIFGREIVDTMFLALKYDAVPKKYESYGLKAIVKAEGLEKPGRSFVDASKIKQYYYNRDKDPETWAKVVQYAEEDADDPIKLFDLMAPSYFYFNQSVSKTFQQMINSATGSQINNMMVRAYLQDGHSIAKASPAEAYEGAISFGVPGAYSNVIKLDVASLYPSIMRAFKVYDPNKDPKKYFLELVETFTIERLKNKKLAKETGEKYYNDLQESQKIAINSMYGFLATAGLSYNAPDKASFITKKGRDILATAVVEATGRNIDYWIAKGC